jgi:hypothetical protein
MAKTELEKAHYYVMFAEGFRNFKDNIYAYTSKNGDIGETIEKLIKQKLKNKE